MTWDDWSEFELSKCVAKFVTSDGLVEDNGIAVHIHQYHNGCCIGWKTFSINNPADMWPIILENGISLIKFKSGYQAVSEGWNYIDVSNNCDINDCCIGADQFDCGHENAFRAAAIVFLMIKGVKPDERI